MAEIINQRMHRSMGECRYSFQPNVTQSRPLTSNRCAVPVWRCWQKEAVGKLSDATGVGGCVFEFVCAMCVCMYACGAGKRHVNNIISTCVYVRVFWKQHVSFARSPVSNCCIVSGMTTTKKLIHAPSRCTQHTRAYTHTYTAPGRAPIPYNYPHMTTTMHPYTPVGGPPDGAYTDGRSRRWQHHGLGHARRCA